MWTVSLWSKGTKSPDPAEVDPDRQTGRKANTHTHTHTHNRPRAEAGLIGPSILPLPFQIYVNTPSFVAPSMYEETMSLSVITEVNTRHWWKVNVPSILWHMYTYVGLGWVVGIKHMLYDLKAACS